ncbi:MAG TPA: YciI family protein [Ktedonosporobacter sp.]|nr:YciI family protein [Ktedonosporobacter sp.]
MPRFLIILTRTPSFSTDTLAGHRAHIAILREAGQLLMYGPFSDSTGGAYLMHAESLAEAVRFAHADPLIKSGASTCVVKEWQIRENG